MGEVKRNIIKIISLVFVVCAIALQVTNNMSKEELYDDISFEYINTKDMAKTKLATKVDNQDDLIDSVFTGSTSSSVEEVALPKMNGFQEVEFAGVQKIVEQQAVPKRI